MRGFALLGILLINMRYFAMPLFRMNDPNFPGDHYANADFWSWFGTNLLFEDKMLALFSMLFGAGIYLMADRGWWLHYRRMFFLLLIGLFHACFLWFGDILMTYALCGMVVRPMKQLPAAVLLFLGLSGVMFSFGQRSFPTMLEQLQPAAQETELEAEHGEVQPPAADEAQKVSLSSRWVELRNRQRAAFQEIFAPETEREAHTGSWWQLFQWRLQLIPWWHGAGFLLSELFRCGGLMLIGMALMALNFFNGKQKASVYASVAAVTTLLGLAVVALGVWPQTMQPLGHVQAAWDGQPPMPTGLQRLFSSAYLSRQIGIVLVSLAWASWLLVFCKSRWIRPLLFPLSSAGHMALSLYLSQTVICLLIFEGWAGGRWGTVRYAEQLQWAAVILAAQLVFAMLWFSWFRFGPMEWLWRSMSYGRRQPWRKASPANSTSIEPTPIEPEIANPEPDSKPELARPDPNAEDSHP
ncbi:MAG: DUF418 domain-containing protein [Planctomycetota bacterium]|nr:MAG: DUF418 domain-containing protein [Planctomycetota bacterium]